jgi:cyanophycinase
MSLKEANMAWTNAKLILTIFVCLSSCSTLMAQTAEKDNIIRETQTPASSGHLMMIGGGLLPNNTAVFEKMVEYAGGVDKARFVVVPTASVAPDAGQSLIYELGLYGIPQDHVRVLEVREHNASTSTSDPDVLNEVRNATAVFMSGGDQRRLVRLLTNKDGSDTPLLHEIRQVYKRGGLIAGTSAGASAQSETMLAVSGLPDMLVDEGLDTLDFGLTSDERQRGLLITRGLGFFRQGIIDQHFLQFRGRLGRLTRATAERKIPFGFGIDKNSAMVLHPDGNIEVVGGYVMIVEPGSAGGLDGPL